MKNDSTTMFLNIVLAALVMLGVLFALLNIWRTSDLRHLNSVLQVQMQRFQGAGAKAQMLLNDTIQYNASAKNPELAQIIQSALAPAPAPAAR